MGRAEGSKPQVGACVRLWFCPLAVPAVLLCTGHRGLTLATGRWQAGACCEPSNPLPSEPRREEQSQGRGNSPVVEGIGDDTIPSPLSLWLPLPPAGHQVSPTVPTPPLPSLPSPPQTHAHVEQEHLEALFQPFTIVRITTSSQEMLLRRRQSYSPSQEGATERQKQTGMNSLHGRRGSAPAPPAHRAVVSGLTPMH